jgi:hypothetical protein
MTRKEAPSKLEGLPGDWPVDLKPDAFVSAPSPPWLPEGALAGKIGEPSFHEPFAVGDTVRLLREPPAFATLSRETRRKYGALEGELFEVVALTLPGELAIARRVETGLQALFVPADCVEAVDFTPSQQPSGAPPAIAGEDDSEDDDNCDTLDGFTRGECARLVRLPFAFRQLPRRERRLFRSLIGERFEIWALSRIDREVHLARAFESEQGERGIEVFVVPIECIEPAERGPDFEEAAAAVSH